MTISIECESGDYASGENLIRQFNLTTVEGISEAELKTAEISACRSMFNHHVHDHRGHTATYSFSIPEGYVNRGGIIYKAK